ncbi:MAG: hypothetical protein ACPL3C_12505, partial [Pyrobaculum sp.]
MTEFKCSAKSEYQGTTNIRRLELYYSLKNNKWIKGYINGSRVRGDVLYALFPGRYVKCSLLYWNKQDPPYTLSCYEVVLIPEKDASGKDSCREEVEHSASVAFYERESGAAKLKEMGLPMLADLITWLPHYHGGL